MDAETHSGLITPSRTRWRRIPWAIPTGRRPRFWQAVATALPFGALWGSIAAAPTVGNTAAFLGAPYVAFDVTMAVLATAYGVAFIVTARRPWPTKPDGFWMGLIATPAAKVWFGLGFVIPESLAWGITSWLHPTSLATEYLAPLWFLAPVAFLVCMFVAYAYSNRGVKRTILAGLAPSYVMSPDGGWWRNGDTWASVADRVWWNGSAWVSAAAVVPEDALRSPDGNYWWTGNAWCAMPPRARRASN